MLVKIHHHPFWEYSAGVQQVAKLADMVKDVVHGMHLPKVDMRSVQKMLGNVRLDQGVPSINVTMLCSRRKSVPIGISPPFLLPIESKLLIQGFRDFVCRFTGAELTENIHPTMKLLLILLYLLYLRFSMVPVMCHEVKIHYVLDT